MKRDYVSNWPPFRQGQHLPPTPLPEKPVGSPGVITKATNMNTKLVGQNATGLYGIYDKVARDIVGGVLYRHRHEAAAVRMFTEAAGAPNSPIKRAPQDFCLVRMATIAERDLEDAEARYEILEDTKIVLEGTTWAASQQPAFQSPDNTR